MTETVHPKHGARGFSRPFAGKRRPTIPFSYGGGPFQARAPDAGSYRSEKRIKHDVVPGPKPRDDAPAEGARTPRPVPSRKRIIYRALLGMWWVRGREIAKPQFARNFISHRRKNLTSTSSTENGKHVCVFSPTDALLISSKLARQDFTFAGAERHFTINRTAYEATFALGRSPASLGALPKEFAYRPRLLHGPGYSDTPPRRDFFAVVARACRRGCSKTGISAPRTIWIFQSSPLSVPF